MWTWGRSIGSYPIGRTSPPLGSEPRGKRKKKKKTAKPTPAGLRESIFAPPLRAVQRQLNPLLIAANKVAAPRPATAEMFSRRHAAEAAEGREALQPRKNYPVVALQRIPWAGLLRFKHLCLKQMFKTRFKHHTKLNMFLF